MTLTSENYKMTRWTSTSNT